MKAIIVILGLLVLVGCAHSIDGTWKGVYDSGATDGQPPKLFIFNFESDGKTLKGEACDTTSQPDVWVELEDLKREGDTISFTSSPPWTPQLSFNFEGIREDGEIVLTFETVYNGQITGEPQSFTVKREE